MTTDKTTQAGGASPLERLVGRNAPVEQRHGWRVITWSSRTTKDFETRQEAIDYITMNDDEGDWHIEPITEFVTPNK